MVSAYLDLYKDQTASTTNVWPIWTSTTSSLSTTPTWNRWVEITTSSTTTSTATNIWGTWVGTGGAGAGRLYVPARPVAPALVLTPEQIESERVRREERDRLWKAQQAARKAAEDKAQELLMTHLTQAQKDAIKAKNFFIVEGGKSKEKYRIWTTKGVHGNIERLNQEGKPVANLCVQLRETVCPNGDHFLAQKLMLELAEDDILKVANVSRMAA
jgi:hypothetical protein